jgi:antitoxin (DNA-binding transcriptional repressor) of toxin-antitoxin stability system
MTAHRVAPVLQWISMSRHITQRELRNDSGRIMRALDKGKSFIVTRNGVPVGELIPLRQRVFVPADAAQAAFAGAPRVALRRFRKDIDAMIDQDSTPRG